MSPLLTSAVELTLAGMGTVFVFLTLLVLATQAMSNIVARLAVQDASSPDGVTSAEEEEIAAIAAAIRVHRGRT